MKIHEIFHMQQEVRTFAPDVNIATNRLVGIEVELEGARDVEGTVYWNDIDDGSLRNGGVELVLRQPLAGADLRRALHQLQGIFHKHPEINTTSRTSLHVHVDARDLTKLQVRNVLVAYIALESALYRMGGKNRYDNIYCPGVTAALEQMVVMRKIMQDNTFEQGVWDWCKYTGINLKSLSERGSIEFRTHEGTTDLRRIYNWVNVLLKLFDYAINKPSPEAIMEDVRKGPDAMLELVFGSHAHILADDGCYIKYYKNNLINLVQLFNSEEFNFTRTDGSTSEPTNDVEAVVSALQQAIANIAA